jgi:carboxyl-terminal processing protease
MRKFFLLFLVFAAACLHSTPPDLTPDSTRKMISQIMKQHVKYKNLNTFLIKRILHNFLDELDPYGLYFLKSDISSYLHPSDLLLEMILGDMNMGNYSIFYEIYEKMIDAIDRRNSFPDKWLVFPLPEDVDPKEFDNPVWAESLHDLKNRNLRFYTLRLHALTQIYDEPIDNLIALVDKNRIEKEGQINQKNVLLMERQMLVSVLKATTQALDAHTHYFTPYESEIFQNMSQGIYIGIGVHLEKHLNGLKVTKIDKGSSADLSKKIQINDVIIAVNNQSIIGINFEEAMQLLKEKHVGDRIILSLLRTLEDGSAEKSQASLLIKEVNDEDEHVQISSVNHADGCCLYMKLPLFYEGSEYSFSASESIEQSLSDIVEDRPIQGILLDLRGNPGGTLSQAEKICSLFLQRGIIASYQSAKGTIHHLRNMQKKPLFNGPLIIMIDRTSASASELVAQTLKDYGRAIIIGDDRSYGKGTMQKFYTQTYKDSQGKSLGDYKVTQGLFFGVSGKSPQFDGVPSDIVIPGIYSETDVGEKFSRYPLEKSSINPNFIDSLSDIPFKYRLELWLFYQHDMQTILTEYTKHIPTLKKNSQIRLEKNENFQNFCHYVKTSNFKEASKMLDAKDFQLEEGFSILDDLIDLTKAE